MTSIPAPSYVRYVGPGDAYIARYTIGPYRAVTEIAKGVPAAMPAAVADLLLGTGDFEAVDPLDAIGDLVTDDKRRAAEEAEWRARQAEIQRQRIPELREIQAARIDVMREAVIEARQNGNNEGKVVALAVARAVEFEEALKALDAGS